MKKIFGLSFLLLLTLSTFSQGRKYTRAMLGTIDKMNMAANAENDLKCVTAFGDLAGKYPDQWLPDYHASRILISRSFENAGADTDLGDSMLADARKLLDRAMKLAPEESELQVLEALYYIGMMSMDPAIRGPIYYMDVQTALEKASDLNPENPRAAYLEGMMALNMPEFLGGGAEVAKALFLEAEKKFEAFVSDDPLWPDWGADLVKEELEKL